ncbi:MAG: hypothetical protein WCK49_00370 [Myxococcaceae bacterium]
MHICKWIGFVSLLSLGACVAHIQSPVMTQSWAAQSYWVKQSLYGGLFYDDDRYGLVSPEPFEKLTYLKSLAGDYIIPPPSTEIILFGTRVQIQKIEWPTEQNIIKRPLLTPRYLPWIYLTVALDRGAVTLSRERTYVMLVPEEIKSEKALMDWFLNYFSKQDNNLYFLNLSPSEQEAILKPAK